MMMITSSKKFGMLAMMGMLAFASMACKSTHAVKLTPEEVTAYSDKPCDNARIINHRYFCFERAWAEPVEAVGLDNLHKVSEDYYRSAQPESGGFASAEKLGIKTIISVRESDSDNSLAKKEPTSISQEDVGRVLNAIHKAEKPVLVHCRHGSDRTGLITAYYRIVFENWDREDARTELLYGGFGHHLVYSNIPRLVLEGDLKVIKSMTFDE